VSIVTRETRDDDSVISGGGSPAPPFVRRTGPRPIFKHGATRARATKSPALLPPCTTGSVRIRSNLDIKLGRVIGGWQWRAADRRCASRCGHSSKRASGVGVAFVGALCRRIDSQGVDPRSLNWKISSPGKARNRSPAPKPCTTPGRPLVSPDFAGCASAGRSRSTHGAPALIPRDAILGCWSLSTPCEGEWSLLI
jgi:hypothetical protein